MFVVVTGGSGSGKSAYAEGRVVNFQNKERTYIATMFPFDAESHKRIARHREMRKDKGFETVECYTNLKDVRVPDGGTVLLECMSNLTANEMFQDQGAKENTVEEIMKGILSLRQQCEHLIVVTNEIFSDAFSYEKETKTYLKYLGEINAKISEMADEVVEVVYGIPVYHKKYLEKI
ncbi:MAG: bifunctional adenosylcobinamide kinase/adenosylcobinamide-phosphate guanylyltransferase [Eubacteriales bacterium]|nr:bifunctional adenosylcobinamide kinase/adenosylcobinamide-phosphate guanylyltransferase [Eubacteriales bacterium]